MEFQRGDRVEHKKRGKGTFLAYGTFSNESIVEFDKDSDADGETLTVTTHLLQKIKEDSLEATIHLVSEKLGWEIYENDHKEMVATHRSGSDPEMLIFTDREKFKRWLEAELKEI